MNFDDETLMAFVDGELDPTRRAEVEAALAADPELSAAVERQMRVKIRLRDAYAPVLDEPLPERLVAAVRQGAGVVDLAARPKRRPPVLPAWAAMAACLVAGLAGGAALMDLRPAPWIRSGPQGLEASGALGQALERQLASAPGSGPVRIGLTFRSTDGRYCRTFVAESGLAGLACRDAAGWRPQLLEQAGARQQDGYRMAASETPPEVLHAAQAIMDGRPLEAPGEAAARSRGWKP